MPNQRLLAWQSQPPSARTRRHNQRACMNLARRSDQLDRPRPQFDLVQERMLKRRTKPLRLLLHVVDQVRPLNPIRPAWKVFHHRGNRKLSPWLVTLQNQRFQSSACGVNGRRKPGAARAKNYCVMRFSHMVSHFDFRCFRPAADSHQPHHTSPDPISPGRSFTSFTTISPNSVFAHANHGRVNFPALSLSNDSCINPVPAVVSRSQRRHCRISCSSVEVSARYIIDIGHTIFKPSCGPPTPSAALPRKKYGFDSLSTNSRVRLYCASSSPQQPR